MIEYIKRAGLVLTCVYALSCQQDKSVVIEKGLVESARQIPYSEGAIEQSHLELVKIKDLDSVQFEEKNQYIMPNNELVEKVNAYYSITFTKDRWDSTLHEGDTVRAIVEGNQFFGFKGLSVKRHDNYSK